MTNQLTAAEARAWMAQGVEYRVSTGDNCKYQLCGKLLFVKCNTNWYRADEDVFEHSAPFTPYTKTTKRELRERAERAEARVKELEADMVAARRHYHDRVVEEKHTLHSLGYAEATMKVLTAERDAASGKEES